MEDHGIPLATWLARLNGKGRVALRDARVPVSLLFDGLPPGATIDGAGLAAVDLFVEDGNVAAVLAAGSAPDGIELEGRLVWPMLIDAHAHLDKGHIIGRAPDSGGTHPGARDATTQDRVAHWHHDDLIRRMNFGLACAEAHGTAAIRTHLDSHPGQGARTWAAFSEIRDIWSGRVALQGVALVPVDAYGGDYGRDLADLVARYGGLLGGVTRASGGAHGGALGDIDMLLDRLFTLAAERNLDIDLHVDEAAQADMLPYVAHATIRHGYQGRVTCGHCCSLALLSEEVLTERIALIAEAGLRLITLPTVNMYLQDRQPDRTPRWRGVMPVHELRKAGVAVAVAGDNCRDPFYAYGDHDMLDTWREAVRILHLDHPYADAPSLAGPVPAAITGFEAGSIGAGRAADLMIFAAWSMDQLIARPQSDRILLRSGAPLCATPPCYARLRHERAV